MEPGRIALCTDEELLSHLHKGSWPAFDELYNRYWEKLYHAALKVLGDAAAAKDVVQEIFTDLWKRRAQLEIKKGICLSL